MIIRLYNRRDNTENWNNTNPILGAGELGIEYTISGFKKMKIGDGITPWNELNYSIDEFVLLSVYNNHIDNYNDHVNNSLNAHGINNIITDINNLREDLDTLDIISIKGSVDTYANLPDITNILINSAYIVEADETRNNITTIYEVVENNGVKSWEYIGEFKVNLSDYYTKTEIDNKLNNMIILPANTDLDTVITPGFYAGMNLINAPNSGCCSIIVLNFCDPTNVQQIIFNNIGLYYRQCINGVWNDL